MNNQTSSYKKDQSDDFSSSSDEIISVNHQIPQMENKFEDIDEFWANTKTTPKHTVSIGISKNSQHIIPPTKSPLSKMLSFQSTPQRSYQKSISKMNNSPIYVGTSTEDTPYRSNSKESNISSDVSQNEDSMSSSDDITFVDTPITNRPKLQPPVINDEKNIFKLSPLASNKNKPFLNVEISENSYSDASSSDGDIIMIKNKYLNEGKSTNEQNNAIINIRENQEIFNESNNDSSIPLPTFSVSNSSDSENDKYQENIEKTNHNTHDEIITKQNSNKNKKEIKSKNQIASKPAFASPKRISSGLKEETIITELSPFASSKRKKIESIKMPNFRLTQIDQEEEEIQEKDNSKNTIQNIKNDFQEEVLNNHIDDLNKSSKETYESNQNSSFIDDDNNDSIISNDNDSDDDIKTIEKLAKKDPLHKHKMDDLMTHYSPSKKKLSNSNETIEKKDEISAKKKQPISPSAKELNKSDEESESSSKIESKSPKSKSKSSKSKSKSPSKSKDQQQIQKSKVEPKSKGKSKSISDKEEKENSKLQSKTNTKSKSTKQSNSQPSKTKSKSKSKTESQSKSPTISNSQPSKPRTKKASKPRYDFSKLSSDSDDEKRISNLIQIPDQIIDKNNNDDSNSNIDNDDLPIALRRRKRVIVKPLKFWCGEHIVYGLSEDGFQTFQNVSIPEKLRKLQKGEIRVMPKDQKRIPIKEDVDRKLIRVEGGGLVIFEKKVVDFDKSNEVILKKGVKCNVSCKGDSPLIFKIEEI